MPAQKSMSDVDAIEREIRSRVARLLKSNLVPACGNASALADIDAKLDALTRKLESEYAATRAELTTLRRLVAQAMTEQGNS